MMPERHSRRLAVTRLVVVALISGIAGAMAQRIVDVRMMSSCVAALDHARHVVEQTTMKLGARRCK